MAFFTLTFSAGIIVFEFVSDEIVRFAMFPSPFSDDTDVAVGEILGVDMSIVRYKETRERREVRGDEGVKFDEG